MAKGLSKKERQDPLIAFPADVGAAVALLRGIKMRSAGGIVVPVPALQSTIGATLQVRPFASPTCLYASPLVLVIHHVCTLPMITGGK